MNCQGIDRAFARRVVAAVVACLGTLALLPAVAAADEAEALYDPGTVWVIEVDLPQASKEALEADPEGKYQPATMTFKRTNGAPGEVVETLGPKNVEMRLKGSASFKPLSGKAAFKIKIPKDDPSFLGLRKMTLNNMVEDPSMTHETLSYELHRALGVPASRTGFVYLRLNGEDFGVYMNVENYDNVAMAKKLGEFDGDVQHVYEGENGADLKPELVGDFEVDEGPDDISDLEALAAAVNETDPAPWSSVVGPLADLDEITRMWAAEKYSGQIDGYAGGPGLDHPNNYFLATGPDGLFRMLPWGQDETWKGDNHLPFEGEAGVMFEKCLDDTICKGKYLDGLEALQATVPSLALNTLAVCTAEMLAPWQQLEEEESTRFEYDADEIAAAVAETRAFIAARPDELADFLGNDAPAEPNPVDSCPTDSDGGGGDQSSLPPPPTVIVDPPPRLTFGATRLQGSFVATRVVAPGAGAVTQKVTTRINGRRVRACSTQANPPGAGKVKVGCRLSEWVQTARAEGPLKLRVRVEFNPAGSGKSRAVVRVLNAPKRG
ncbi:MAG TPA: CotH kinase family protein [Solirubrobacterales bacterium]